MTRLPSLLLSAAVLVFASSAAAPTASAGTYTVWSCHDAAWNAAPTDGWTIDNDIKPLTAAGAGDSCSNPGGSLAAYISGADGSRIYTPARVGWLYTAPADVTVASAIFETAWGVGYSDGDDGATPAVGITRSGLLTGRSDPQLAAGCFRFDCNRPEALEDTFTPAGRTFGVTVACLAADGIKSATPSCRGGQGGRAHVYLRRARFTMSEGLAPTASDLDAAALGAEPLTGQRTVRLSAFDKGSGLFSAEVRLGGQVVQARSVLSPDSATCTAALKDSGFRSAVPCPSSLPLSFAIDTTKVPDGTHQLTVTLWDAADNQSTVVDRTVTVANGAAGLPSGPNGTGGSIASARFASKKPKSTRSVTYGRTISLADQLVDAKGKALVGATVDVLETRDGGKTEKVATVTSDARGKLRYRPNTTVPKRIEFAYARMTNSTAYVARRSVRLVVNANVALRVSARDIRRLRPVRFTGSAKAGTQPLDAVQVAIETRGPGGWRLAKLLKTDARGRYSWRYTFHIAANWQFRARLIPSGAASALPGTSTVVRVRVRR